MSISVMSRVWSDSSAQGSALLVLLAVADFANDQGTAYPAVKTLADKARMSARNVRYVLDDLVKSGELTISRGQGPKGCNLFRVVAAKIAGGVQGIQPELGFPQGVKPASGGAAIAVAPEPSLTVKESSVKKRPARQIPEGWAPTKQTIDWCREKHQLQAADIEKCVEYFVDYCRSSGRHYADHDAGFKNSVRGDWAKLRVNGQRRAHARDVGLSSKDYSADLPGERTQ